jgi:predicted GH43/DUF377 family glycosyl hydrolase
MALLPSRSVSQTEVDENVMRDVFEKIATPFKRGIVYRHPDSTTMTDSPSIYRWRRGWRMSYIVFDGRGYETWLAESRDLLHWTTLGKVLSFTDTGWDAHQKAGYMALLDPDWGGTHRLGKYQGRYWMSYLGGSVKGYEAGRLATGMAWTENAGLPTEWKRLTRPVLSSYDKDSHAFDNRTIYKSTVLEIPGNPTGKRFLMFYNAKGDTAKYESICLAVSDDMEHWERYGQTPLISRFEKGSISGDAQVVRMGKLYVMFYFGAFWKDRKGAFERFACSYDLVHWTDWKGESLIEPSEPYDRTYAHKPCVVKWRGVVYHFYNAVGDSGRVIALATSKPL